LAAEYKGKTLYYQAKDPALELEVFSDMPLDKIGWISRVKVIRILKLLWRGTTAAANRVDAYRTSRGTTRKKSRS
jgi:hypothetical protein